MQVEVGSILEAKVTGITKFGAFVKFENDQTAMVHISEIAPTFVNDIADHLSVGQTVKVKILNITEEGKISASIKRTLPPPERPQRAPRSSGGNYQAGGNRPAGNRPMGGNRPAGNRPAGGGNRNSNSAQASAGTQPQSQSDAFETMLSRFMKTSDDKMSDMRKTMNVKHQNNRRGGGNRRG